MTDTRDGRGRDGERAASWATLTPEALQDEIVANRRTERRLWVYALVAVLVTAAVLVLHGLTQ